MNRFPALNRPTGINEGEPEMARIRNLVRKAVLNGEIDKTGCIICGQRPAEGHHEDYNRPLEVVWLCRFHHGNRHAYGDWQSEIAADLARQRGEAA